MIRYYYADSLSSYFQCIKEIEENVMKENRKSSQWGEKDRFNENLPLLWYRGLSHFSHSLIPSLFRTNARVDADTGASSLHYAENIRVHHYIAKNYHYFSLKPSSRLEWLEVMQHHGMKTRVMDWSESSVHSLIFALGTFFEMPDQNENSRQFSVPCVWVMDPGEMNREIFRIISQDKNLCESLLSELDFSDYERKRIDENLNRMRQLFEGQENYGASDIIHLNNIINLSALTDEYTKNLPVIRQILLQDQEIPMMYYFLIKIYSMGYILKDRVLPPLCVVHPYHSERIKAQRGVFSVFPHYREQERDQDLRDMQIVPDAMENNETAQKHLYKIILMRPQRIAEEMMINGMDGSWLYPELPEMAKILENHKVK